MVAESSQGFVERRDCMASIEQVRALAPVAERHELVVHITPREGDSPDS